MTDLPYANGTKYSRIRADGYKIAYDGMSLLNLIA